MTNIFGSPEKGSRKNRLFEIGVYALEKAGWTVSRVPKVGKGSVRKISKGKEEKLVSIRTTQDTWIAFPRNEADTEWVTLEMVDAVVAVSVDDQHNPRFAQVHFLDGDEMRDRFDRSYSARKKAGHKIPTGRGMWLSLYLPDANDPVTQVGAGAGLASPAIAKVPLQGEEAAETPQLVEAVVEAPLTIAEARRRLAKTFDVDPTSVKIIIET